MRPKLTIHFGNPSPLSGHIEIDGKPVAVTGLEFIAKPGRMVEAFVSVHPEEISVDVDARCLRLNGAQLPEDVGRALLAQLKVLYGE